MTKAIFLSHPVWKKEFDIVKEMLNNPKDQIKIYASKYDKYLINELDINIIGIEDLYSAKFENILLMTNLNRLVNKWLSYDDLNLFYSKKQHLFESIRYSLIKELAKVIILNRMLNFIIDSKKITEIHLLKRSSHLSWFSSMPKEKGFFEQILENVCKQKKNKV